MAGDGSVAIDVNLDVSKADKELARLKKEIEKLENGISPKEEKKIPLVEQAERLSQELKIARAQAAQYKTEWESGTLGADGDWAASVEKAQQLEAEYTKITGQIDKIDSKLIPMYTAVDKAKSRAGEMAEKLAQGEANTKKMNAATKAASSSMGKFSNRLKNVVSGALIFTVISQALAKFREWMEKVIKTNDEAKAAIARLKGSLLTLVQPLVDVIIPAFTTFVNVLSRVASVAAKAVSMLFGTSEKASATAAESLYNETESIEDVGDAAKKAGKSLAGFDELNTLSGDDSTSTDNSASSRDTIAPDFSGPVSDGLTSVVELFVGAALLALGAILTFSGANIFLGIGLMVLGAFAVWDAVSTNWEVIQGYLQGPIGALIAILGAAALAIGAILAFSGAAIPLGIGLMIVGAAALAAVVAVNWDSIVEALRGPIGAVVALVGASLLVIGVILLFTGVGIPLGIGLILIGAAGLAAPIAANWNAIVDALRGPIGLIVGIVSGALLVLGIILIFTGVGIPLGIGLIIAGVAGLVAAIAPNWNFILDKVKEIWGKLKNWWNTSASKFFTAEYWKQLGKSMVNGLISMIERGINWVVDKINWFVSKINGGLGVLSAIGIDIQIPTIPKVSIPRLATGAVIPPNQEFLAVLGDQKHGTNVEAPLETIVEAMMIALGKADIGGETVVRFEGNLAQLARVLNPVIQKEQRRASVFHG